jgi:hypothetical protein
MSRDIVDASEAEGIHAVTRYVVDAVVIVGPTVRDPRGAQVLGGGAGGPLPKRRLRGHRASFQAVETDS